MKIIKRRQFIHYSFLTIGSSVLAACSSNNSSSLTDSNSVNNSASLDKVVFGTNWYAQGEHGGFYQAVATDIYKNQGLDVTIKMGGSQINGTQLLMGGAIDFYMGFGTDAIKAVENNIPKITVAAIFQKDPQVIIAHPGVGHDTLESLKGKPIYISAEANTAFWPFLKAKYGFTDEQKRPYNFNITPFLRDKNSAQQGYISSEPLKIEKEADYKPIVFLLADYGYNPYATTIETRKELVSKNPDLVQRFVDASIKGWYSYLDNPEPGNKLIKEANPEMTDEQLAYSLEKIKEYGLVISGEAETKGIGAMTEEHWQSFFEAFVDAGIFQSDTDYQQAFTLDFVNKGVALYQAK
jgi:NitT/TauT family transport system substrate-binding protein